MTLGNYDFVRMAEGRRKLDEMKSNAERLNVLLEKGVITPNLKEYSEQLMIMDFAIWESRQEAEAGFADEAAKGLFNARLALDGVYSIFHNKYPHIKRKLPSHYTALINHAKKIYESSKVECEKILGEAA